MNWGLVDFFLIFKQLKEEMNSTTIQKTALMITKEIDYSIMQMQWLSFLRCVNAITVGWSSSQGEKRQGIWPVSVSGVTFTISQALFYQYYYSWFLGNWKKHTYILQ